jgi:hypothetical protein
MFISILYMFRATMRPSSGESIVSIRHLVYVTLYRWPFGVQVAPSTIAADSSNGVTNTRCCRYSCMRSWWWVEVPPETCRAFPDINKLCNVASCWIYEYIGILLGVHCILHISRIRVNVHWVQKEGTQICIPEWSQGLTLTQNVDWGFLLSTAFPTNGIIT